MLPKKEEFRTAIESKGFDLTPKQIELAARFGEILHHENQAQNLTRILGVDAFIDGHLVDVIRLLKSPYLGERILDVGTGSGVPGLLAAAMDLSPSRVWFLTESEIQKADFLTRTCQELGLKRVSVLSKRVESVIEVLKPDTVMARAVGTVEKISAWIWNCSTWNNLILFKSRGWQEEWTNARLTKFGKKLTVTHVDDYSNSERTRLLITLSKKKFG